MAPGWLQQAQTHGSPPTHDPAMDTDTNRIVEDSNHTYDDNGNMTRDGLNTLVYDAENRVVRVNSSNPTYVYDADGRRGRTTVAGVITDFVYDADGNVIAERQGTTWTRGFVYLGGQMLMQYDNVVSPATAFAVHKDHLGSTRLLTKVDESLQECNDYYPYGELIPCGTPTTTTTQKFTGKERDTESNLDNFFARYYASYQGRFRSPDPICRLQARACPRFS